MAERARICVAKPLGQLVEPVPQPLHTGHRRLVLGFGIVLAEFGGMDSGLVRSPCDSLSAQNSLRARCSFRPPVRASTFNNGGCLEECAFRGDGPDLEGHGARKLFCADNVRAGASACRPSEHARAERARSC